MSDAADRAYAKQLGVCTRCFGFEAEAGYTQCVRCLAEKRAGNKRRRPSCDIRRTVRGRRQKRCGVCGCWGQLTRDFARSSHSGDGRQYRCKFCCAESKRERRARAKALRLVSHNPHVRTAEPERKESA